MSYPEPNSSIPLEIVREDEEILVVAKPSGRVSLPGAGHASDSVQNAAMAHAGTVLGGLGAARDYGLLHRLDRASSGLLLFAKSPRAYDRLREDFARRRIRKDYLAITAATPIRGEGVLRQPLAELRLQDRKVSRPDPQGSPAVTHYRLRARGRSGVALLECRIETGRLHQIRAHLSSIGAPLLGDLVYAKREPDGRASIGRKADREILLHAWRLGFKHPGTGESLLVELLPPSRFLSACRQHGLPFSGGGRKPSLQKPRKPRS
ncbi:MAG TPA: RluA family pseudouridine synthase [Deltaproteobacteria bacterium]|nr:RluA family pseudouridine synthase [Deltaproteobacteria bacterium]